MGNTSGSEFGGIMIRTEKQLYFAGDVVKGYIYLHIIKAGYQGRIVEFLVVGKEKTRWSTGSGKNRRTHYGKNKFHEQAVVVHQFHDEHLQVGQFAFPFELHLPSGLPGSYFLESYVLASLNYKVKARVISTNKSINNIINKQEITLREPIKELLHPLIQQETAQLSTCCCMEKGPSTFQGKITKNLYFPNEIVEIQYDADNSLCKLDIEKIEVILVNRLTIRSNGGARHVSDFSLSYVTHGGIQKGMKISPTELQKCQLQISHIAHPEYAVTPSSNGDFVNSVYYVIIRPTYEGCTCCSSKPIVQMPITVLAPLPQEYLQPIQQPDNWQPQEFQPLVIKPNSDNPFMQQNQNLNQMANPMQF